MAATLQYNFDHFAAPNSAGGRTINRPDGAVIVAGPGSSKSMSLANAHSCLAIDLSGTTSSDACFHVRQVFRFETSFKGHQHLAQSERIPFRLELVSDGNLVYLAGSTSTTSGWRTLKGDSPISPGEWHSADLVFERGLLALLLNGRPIGCYGFSTGSVDVDDSQTEAFLGGMIPATRFKGQIADFQLSTSLSIELKQALMKLRDTPQFRITSKAESSREHVDLGDPIEQLAFASHISSWRQQFQNGEILYHQGSGAYVLHGAIHERYHKLGDIAKDKLGHLLSDVKSLHNGQVSHFQGGNIYWSRETGALEVLKPIQENYEAGGGPTAWGFPTGEQIPVNGGSFQPMKFGTFYLQDGSTSAYVVNQDILRAFVESGGLSKWGYPTSNETRHSIEVSGNKRQVHVAEFENGTFYWSEATGAHAVQGAIREKWRQLGGADMHYIRELGLPTSDEMAIPGTHDGRINSFEQGVIIYSPRQKFIKAIYPFKISIGTLETVPWEGGKEKHDIYFTVILNQNDETIFCRRYPESDAFGASNNLEVNVQLPMILRPNPNVKITLTVDVWDLAQEGLHVNLGNWVEDFHAANAWGMLDGRLEFESGPFKGIKNITASVSPQVG